MMRGLLGGAKSQTLVDWRNYIREILVPVMESAPQMGGQNEVVQIDESYFRLGLKLCNN